MKLRSPFWWNPHFVCYYYGSWIILCEREWFMRFFSLWIYRWMEMFRVVDFFSFICSFYAFKYLMESEFFVSSFKTCVCVHPLHFFVIDFNFFFFQKIEIEVYFPIWLISWTEISHMKVNGNKKRSSLQQTYRKILHYLFCLAFFKKMRSVNAMHCHTSSDGNMNSHWN